MTDYKVGNLVRIATIAGAPSIGLIVSDLDMYDTYQIAVLTSMFEDGICATFEYGESCLIPYTSDDTQEALIAEVEKFHNGMCIRDLIELTKEMHALIFLFPKHGTHSIISSLSDLRHLEASAVIFGDIGTVKRKTAELMRKEYPEQDSSAIIAFGDDMYRIGREIKETVKCEKK